MNDKNYSAVFQMLLITTTVWLPDNCQMTAWWLPDNCLKIAWQLPDNSKMIAWIKEKTMELLNYEAACKSIHLTSKFTKSLSIIFPILLKSLTDSDFFLKMEPVKNFLD